MVGLCAIAWAWLPLTSADRTLLVTQDMSEESYPWWTFAAQEIQQGRIPYWDPYTNGGHTFIGMGETWPIYPPFVALAAFGGSWAASADGLQAFAFLHAVVAFVGAYVLGRAVGLRPIAALGTGLVFALGGYFSLRALDALNLADATAWSPLTLAGILLMVKHGDARWGWLSGAAFGLSILAGHAEPAFHSAVACVVILCGVLLAQWSEGRLRRDLARVGRFIIITACTALCVAGVQIFTIIEYQSLALRWVGAADPVRMDARIPYETIAANPSLDLASLARLVDAGALRTPDSDIFIGWIAVLACAVGIVTQFRRSLAWAVLVIMGVALALGDHTPLLRVVYLVVPWADKFREPVRAFLLAHLGFSVLAGLGIESVASARFPVRDVLKDAAAAVLVTLVALQVGAFWATSIPKRGAYDGVEDREVDQHFFGSAATSLRDFVHADSGYYRVDLTDTGLPRNFGDVLRVPTVGGYAGTRPAAIQTFQDTLGWVPPTVGSSLLGVKYLVSPRFIEGTQVVGRVENWYVLENPGALPLAWFASGVAPVRSDWEALSLLGSGGIDPTVVTSSVNAGVLSQCVSRTSGAAAIEQYLPGRIRITTDDAEDGLLVSSQAYYPGWSVTIDGLAAQLIPVDFMLSAVCVPAGHHDIDWRFEPDVLTIATYVCVLSLVAACAVAVAETRSRSPVS
jgi:hypothetical protein